MNDEKTNIGDEIRRFQSSAEQAIQNTENGAHEKRKVVAEARWYDAQASQLEIRNERWRHDMELRKQYAQKAFALAGWAVWFWMVMFTAVGIGNAASGKQILTDTGLITLTSGATVNVIAVCIAVVRGLFPSNGDKEK